LNNDEYSVHQAWKLSNDMAHAETKIFLGIGEFIEYILAAFLEQIFTELFTKLENL